MEQRSLAAGRYELRALLGVGGMAKVYTCWDTMLHVNRAAKVLNPALMKSDTVQKRFLNEARTMARLRHPNIVQVVDVGMDGEAAFMVMELVSGGSLQDRIHATGPLRPHAACRMTLSILEGLAAAHKDGVIHRDIKPQNILLDENDQPKVTDFGIARIDKSTSHMTKTGAVMGTMGFMAPEQRISARTVDGRADLYAVGTTLYAALTGQMPIELYASELDDELLTGIPDALKPIISRATKYKPDDRYDDAAAMAEAIQQAMDRIPEDEPAASLPDTPSRDGDTLPPDSMTGFAGGAPEASVAAQALLSPKAPPPPPVGIRSAAPSLGTLDPSTPAPITDLPVDEASSPPKPEKRLSVAGVAAGLLLGLVVVGGAVTAIVLAATWQPDPDTTRVRSADVQDVEPPTEVQPQAPPTEKTVEKKKTSPHTTKKSAPPAAEPDAPPPTDAEPEAPEVPEAPEAAPQSTVDAVNAMTDPSDLKALNGTWTGEYNGLPMTLNLFFNRKGAVGGNATMSVKGAEISLKVSGTHHLQDNGDRRIALEAKRVVGGDITINGTIVDGERASGRVLFGTKDRGGWSATH